LVQPKGGDVLTITSLSLSLSAMRKFDIVEVLAIVAFTVIASFHVSGKLSGASSAPILVDEDVLETVSKRYGPVQPAVQ
jgi:hypothetical protein